MDKILESFLHEQFIAVMALVAESDIVTAVPVAGMPPNRYILEYRCRGLVYEGGEPALHDRFVFGVWMPESYLRGEYKAGDIVTVLSPRTLFHPNVHYPHVCLGDGMPAGTPLTDIVFQLYEMVTYGKLTMDESNAFNPIACQWSRANPGRIPLETRPLKRRTLELRFAEKEDSHA